MVKLEDGSIQSYTTDEVGQWVRFIISNPPDNLYYLNGREVSVRIIKGLDPAKVKTANILKGKEAIAKYGAKAAAGVILFTTE